MLLTEQNHKADVPEAFNPYTKAGARNVARKFKDTVQAMVVYADERQAQYKEGWAFLAYSPLKSKPYVAAAMITLGLLEQGVGENGACKLRLTDLARKHLEAAA